MAKKRLKKQTKLIFDKLEENRCSDCGTPVPLNFSFCDPCEEKWWSTDVQEVMK